MKVAVRNRFSTFHPDSDDYPIIVLERDNWNDYSYYTTFGVELRTSDTESIDLKTVRLMVDSQQEGISQYPFNDLPSGAIVANERLEGICSLSPVDGYYDTLGAVDLQLASEVLSTLRDAAFMPAVRDHFQSQPCFKISLLRDSSARELLDTAGARFGTDRALINKFHVEILLDGASAPHNFDFDFSDKDGIPYRLNAVVGLNGVGKTQVMARLAMLLSRFSREAVDSNRSTLQANDVLDPVPSIYRVAAVSFSAFDEFERPTDAEGDTFSYSYCGLQKEDGRLKNKHDLLTEIREMISNDMTATQRDLLKSALHSLVRVEDIDSFVDNPEVHRSLYERLSAGQRLALNCICHIVAKCASRTLILFDEPELHLHPQLLTGLMTALSGVLNQLDSFAVVATHSPLVIQQLPKECVYVIRRDRMKPIVLKPTFQTFGESLSEITRFVFSSTENERDYREVLEAIFRKRNGDIDETRSAFGGLLSLNAEIYLESLLRDRDEGGTS